MTASTFMTLALAEAELARGRTAPNPPVGAVLVRDGQVIGRGHTQPPGGPHAEVMALRQAGPLAGGSTLYVTLEPCCHYGRTPPCTNAVIAAGVASVVVAVEDPNPLVAGKGLARLRASGVTIRLHDGLDEASRLLRPFFKHVRTGLPYVTVKWAMTLDGRISSRTGDARWISGREALLWAHRLRDAVDAVLVGVGTVVADDPRLTVRLSLEELVVRDSRPQGPLRVVLDSHCRLPLHAALLSPELAAHTLLFATKRATTAACSAVVATGAEVCIVAADTTGRVDVRVALEQLGRRGLLHVLVEGGAEVHASVLEHGLADEVAVVVAPKLIGGRDAPGPVGGRGTERLTDALTLEHVRTLPLGEDYLIEGRLPPDGRLAARSPVSGVLHRGG